MRQVHGATVAVVDGTEPQLVEADALVTDRAGLVLSVNVADCAPVALFSPQGVIGAVHAGWRGAELGVIEAAVATMRSLGARQIRAWLGPCIHAECYEFGEADLGRLAERFGPAVRARTRGGQPALDVPMAVAAALGGTGVELAGAADMCTACDPQRFYSFRARGDRGRHTLALWMEERVG